MGVVASGVRFSCVTTFFSLTNFMFLLTGMSESGGMYKMIGGPAMDTDQVKAVLKEAGDSYVYISAVRQPGYYPRCFTLRDPLAFHHWMESDNVNDLHPLRSGRWNHRPLRGVTVLEMTRVCFSDAISMVNCTPFVKSLELMDMTVPSLTWIPQSVIHLTMMGCTVGAWDCCFPNVILLHIRACQIPGIPLNMDKIFPNLRLLKLSNSGVGALGGVVFPPKLQFLDLSENRDLSIRGVVFPNLIVSLRMCECTHLDGFCTSRLPSGLRFLDFRGCQAGWIGKKFVVPATLEEVYMGARHGVDVRPFADKVDSFTKKVSMQSSLKHDAGDAIVMMLFNNVLPWELLHLVCGFLM